MDADNTINILLVEDDEVDRLTIRHSLKKADFKFDLQETVNLSAAMDALKNKYYDCIIMDYKLPDGDGLLLLKMIRSMKIDTPVVALSGYGDEQLVVEMMHAGAADYVSKDFLNTDSIIKSISTVTRVHRAEQERITAELKVKESNETINNILESISDAFLAVNKNGEFTYINKQAEIVLRVKRENLIGNKFWDRLPKSEIWFSETIQKTFDLNEPLHIEKFYTPLQSWLELNFYPAQDCVSVYFRDITSRKNTEKLLDYLAKHDELTKLSNRFSFLDILESTIRRALVGDHIIGLLYIDLDRFKLINDSLGHAAGDELLQSVSRVLLHSIKSKDTVARIGGDEFVVLLTELKHEDDAFSVAKGIHQALLKPHIVSGREMIVTSSVGVSVFPNDASSAEGLINHADRAMYSVKGKGKNAVLKFSPAIKPGLNQRLEEESKLRRAIENGSEMEVYYQPQLNTKENTIVGVEALVRWNHPDRGLLYPTDFIALAEEIGIIEIMGQWVLENVLQHRQSWSERGFGDLRVAINVSHREFVCTDFRKMLLDTLGDTDLSSGWLELELTENIILEDRDSSIRLLQELRAMGIEFAMDDFGTGYSSLVYLRQLPLTTIKIDRTFTRDIGGSDKAADAVVSAIINLAHSLGIRVIAEGVEYELQAEFLQNNGCDILQGFYIARAMPHEKLCKYILDKLDSNTGGNTFRIVK